MPGKSDYLENKVLNWAYKATTMGTAPAAVYVGLFNGDPLDTAAGGTEVTTTVRVAGRVAATFGSVSGGQVANSADVDFGNAAGAATMTHFATFDAASAGNMLHSGPLTGGTQGVLTGTPVKFTTGLLVITED